MNIEEVLSTTHRISPRERVPFHCTCCGECCRHVRQSVPLESPDVFRLTRLLREKDKGIICMDDFIARYTELALLDECGYFMLMHNEKKPALEVPQTGDNSHMALWLGLLGISGIGAAAILLMRKRKK